MKLKDLVDAVSKEAELTEKQAEICIITAFKVFSEISEDELAELLNYNEEE